MILVDQSIAVEGREVTPAGTAVERYRGPLDDEALVEEAHRSGHRVLVLAGDGHLTSEGLVRRASELGVVLVVVPDQHPLRAAQRVLAHADALRDAEGPVLRLLAHGPEPAALPD